MDECIDDAPEISIDEEHCSVEDVLDTFRRASKFWALDDVDTTNFQRLNTRGPLRRILKASTDPTMCTKLGSVYWVPKSLLPVDYEKAPWYDQCIIEPLDVSYVKSRTSKFAHKIGIVDKTYSVVYDAPDYIGIPRFLGLSLFGGASKDARSYGDTMTWPAWTSDTDRSMRPEQDLAIKWALEDLERWGGTFIEADCGVGKTAIALNLCHRLGKRSMFIVPNTELLHQVKEAAEKVWCPGVHIGIIQGKDSIKKCLKASKTDTDDQNQLVIASIDTLTSAGPSWPKEFFRRFGVVVVDEAHHIAAKCLSQVLPLLPSRYIIGLSATPNRKDGLQPVIHWLLGPLSFRFQRLPYLLKATGLPYVPTLLQWIKISHRGVITGEKMPPLVTQQQRLARNTYRDTTIARTLIDATKDDERRRVIFLTLFCDHASRFYERLKSMTDSTVGLSTGESVEGEPIATAKFIVRTWQKCGEGFDDKTLTDLVLMLPRSTIQQVVGRVQRLHEGKTEAYIWDIQDDNFGDPMIDGMRFTRMRFYKERGIRSVSK